MASHVLAYVVLVLRFTIAIVLRKDVTRNVRSEATLYCVNVRVFDFMVPND